MSLLMSMIDTSLISLARAGSTNLMTKTVDLFRFTWIILNNSVLSDVYVRLNAERLQRSQSFIGCRVYSPLIDNKGTRVKCQNECKSRKFE
jgi:hypothetical protein